MASRINFLVMRSTPGGWRHSGGKRLRFGEQRLGRNDFGDEAPLQRRRRIDGLGGEEQFRSARHADGTRQVPGPAVTGDQTDLEECRTEHRVARCDADVGQTCHIVAETDGRAIYRGDQRHFDSP